MIEQGEGTPINQAIVRGRVGLCFFPINFQENYRQYFQNFINQSSGLSSIHWFIKDGKVMSVWRFANPKRWKGLHITLNIPYPFENTDLAAHKNYIKEMQFVGIDIDKSSIEGSSVRKKMQNSSLIDSRYQKCHLTDETLKIIKPKRVETKMKFRDQQIEQIQRFVRQKDTSGILYVTGAGGQGKRMAILQVIGNHPQFSLIEIQYFNQARFFEQIISGFTKTKFCGNGLSHLQQVFQSQSQIAKIPKMVIIWNANQIQHGKTIYNLWQLIQVAQNLKFILKGRNIEYFNDNWAPNVTSRTLGFKRIIFELYSREQILSIINDDPKFKQIEKNKIIQIVYKLCQTTKDINDFYSHLQELQNGQYPGINMSLGNVQNWKYCFDPYHLKILQVLLEKFGKQKPMRLDYIANFCSRIQVIQERKMSQDALIRWMAFQMKMFEESGLIKCLKYDRPSTTFYKWTCFD